MSDETRAKMRASQQKRRDEQRANNPPAPPAIKEKTARPPLSAKHRAAISAARKAAGIPEHVREAQRKALTGRKRKPFTEETISKMRIAATLREAARRQKRLAV